MPSYPLHPWQWALAFIGAALIGLSKTGIPGIGIFAVTIFALVVPDQIIGGKVVSGAVASSGVVLPILISADVIAVAAYRKHAQWHHLWRLFPWAIAGVLAGSLTLEFIPASAMNRLLGVILLGMVALHYWRKKHAGEEIPTHPGFTASMGVAGGFTTMVANAAGPVMNLYLLAMRLPKLEFIGTGAWYFFLLNTFKVPFSTNLGFINAASLRLDAPLMLMAIVGAVFGRKVVPYINQELFETIALASTVVGALKLLF